MNRRREGSSVVLIPPTGEEQAALDRARTLMAVDDQEVESLRRRLDHSGMPPRRQLLAWGRLVFVTAAATAAVVLALIGIQVLGPQDGSTSDHGPRMVVQTGAGQTHSFSPTAGMTVLLDESSHLDVDPSVGEQLVLTLAQGAVDVDYKRPSDGPGLLVLAGDVVVTVTGTRFTVDRGDHGVAVSVIRGSVVVSWPDGEAVVERGGSWRSWSEVRSADAVTSSEETASQDSTAAAQDGAASATGDGNLVGAVQGMDSAEPEVSATQDAGTSAPDPGAAEFELGDDAMLLNQILVEAASGTPAAERLFAMEQYLARYPGSDNADLVLAERVEALADIGADREVLAAAETFIQQYPDSSRRSQVRWVEATVARDRLRDCSRALRAYRELAEAGGTHHVEAMYYRGVCAAEEGYPQEASQSLERAIELGLDPTREREARALLDSLR